MSTADSMEGSTGTNKNIDGMCKDGIPHGKIRGKKSHLRKFLLIYH